MEVNSSPGLEGIETTTGKNVAGMIIEREREWRAEYDPDQGQGKRLQEA
jgi:ribosomal protein S6--L-glutamate ligase